AVGLARFSYFIFELLLKLPAGRLVDRIGSRIPLMVGLITSAVSILLIYFAVRVWNSPSLVVVGCALQGAGAAPLWPAVIAALVNGLPENRRGEIMGYILTAWMVGLGGGFFVANTLLYEGFQFDGSTW